MWERCKAPGNLAEKKIVLAIESGANFKLFSGEKYVGYTRGCDAMVIAFDDFTEQPQQTKPTKSTAPVPPRPLGSASEEPLAAEQEQPPTLAETLAHYLECAKRGESIEGMMEKLQEIARTRSKKLPTVYTWEKAKEVLKKAHWNGSAIEWWNSKLLESAPPRLQLRTKFAVEPDETGAEALDKAGIIRLQLPVELEPWTAQPARVRRFWRAVLGFLGEFNKGMTLPAEEMCKMFDYVNNYLPVFWRFRRRKLIFIRDKSEQLPLCDRDYFIRLFDFAVVVRRAGIANLWPQDSCAVPLKNAINTVKTFVDVRYPWLTLPSREQLMADAYLDQACAMLWNTDDLIELDNPPDFKFEKATLERVVRDCVDSCTWSKQLEVYNADNFGSAPDFDACFSDTVLDARRIWAEIKERTHWVSGTPVCSGPQTIAAGRLCHIATKKIPSKRSTPEFVKFTRETKLIKRELLDLNWVVCTESFSQYVSLFPKWLLLMEMRVPILPVSSVANVNSRLAYTVLVQDDDVWLGQRHWSARLPLYRIDADKLYINTGYAAFSRELLKYKIACLLQ